MSIKSICMAGVNHKSTPFEIRECLAMDDAGCGRFLSLMQNSNNIQEAIVVSTCNRTELYVVSDETEDISNGYLPTAMLHFARLNDWHAEQYFYQAQGLDAVDHLFRVAAGLDSMVLGENQIIGQLRNAYSRSVKRGMVDTMFHKLFHQAFRVGKRIRTETKINEGSSSIGSVTVDLVNELMPDSLDKNVLIIGAGEMAQATLLNLQKLGKHRVKIANRTLGKAQDLAQKFSAEAVPFSALRDALKEADLVICSTGSKTPVVTSAMVRDIMVQRDIPLYMIDIAMPRNIDKSAGVLSNVYLYDLDGLKNMVEQNIQMRTAEIPKAESIIHNEIESFVSWHAKLDVTPTIKQLQQHFENIRQREMKRNSKFFEKESWEQIDKFSRSLLNKILHAPMMCLRQCSGASEACRRCTVKEVFGLDGSQ